MASDAAALGEPHPEPELGEDGEEADFRPPSATDGPRSLRDNVLLAAAAHADPDRIDDAPPGRQEEVIALLAKLKPPDGRVGGLPELREWTRSLPRLVGVSQKATLKVCRYMADCIGAERPPRGELTRESLQQAFMRIGGAREVVNAMVLHSGSADSVMVCLRCMSAATQGAPFAAETLELQSIGGVTPILRCVEKHSAHVGVATAGVELIAHLCAPLPDDGREVAPARTRAHREMQHHLVSHGALDLIANLIGLGLKTVHDESVKAQLSVAAHASKGLGAAKVASNASDQGVQEYQSKMENMQRLRSFVSTRALWGKYLETERSAGRLQEVGLQALVLLGAGNADTSRVLAGALWCYEARHNLERRRAPGKGSRLAARRASRASAAPQTPGAIGGNGGAQPQQGERASIMPSISEGGSRASVMPRRSPSVTPTPRTPVSQHDAPARLSVAGTPRSPIKPRKTLFDGMAIAEEEGRQGSRASARSNASNAKRASGVFQRSAKRVSKAALLGGPTPAPPETIDPNSPLATAEAFARGAYLPIEVLRARACRDRPEVVARACRLIEALAAHHAGLLRKVSHGAALRASQVAVAAAAAPGATTARAVAAAAAPPLPGAASARAFAAGAAPPGTASARLGGEPGGAAGGGADPAAADGTAPGGAEAPLVTLLLPVAKALMLATRLHRLDPEVLGAALRALGEMRQVALLSAPEGEAEPSWQAVIAQSQEEEGELGETARVLEQAIRHTDVANSRMAIFQVGPEQLCGSGGRMSPRLRRAAAQAVTDAKALSDDVMAAKWARGDPERVAVLDAEARRLEEEAAAEKKNARWSHLDGQRSRARQARRALRPGSKEEAVIRGSGLDGPTPTTDRSAAAAPAPGLGVEAAADATGRPPGSAAEDAGGAREAASPDLQDSQEAPQPCHVPDSEAPPAPTAAADAGDRPAVAAAGGDRRAARADRRATRAQQQEEVAAKPPSPPPQWLRALGYGSHDAADFDRVWRQPLTDVMTRSFSTPSLAGSRLGSQSTLGSRLASLSTPGAAAQAPEGGAAQQVPGAQQAQGAGAADALDRLLGIEMLRSQPGRLKARITVQPPTKVSQATADARLKELTDQGRAASLVGSELAKQMRKNRCLLPRYGLQVTIKKARSQPRMLSESKSGVSRVSTLESTMGTSTPGVATAEALFGVPEESAEM